MATQSRWGWCPECKREVKWVRRNHHSGERMYQCVGCLKSWRSHPVKRRSYE